MSEVGFAPWAIVPVKRLAMAKLRLALALGPEREAFARILALRTIQTLIRCGSFRGVIVMTADRVIAADALSMGAMVLDDQQRSLNEACGLGIAAAAERQTDACVIVPADLARLTTEAASRVVREYRNLRESCGADVVGLIRSRDGSGTNMVLLDPRLPMSLAFGPASFAAHLAAAGARAHEIKCAEASFDVDTVEDLLDLAATPRTLESTEPLAVGLRRFLVMIRPHDPTFRLLIARAAALRDAGHDQFISYSRKVFLPLTQLCRDTCRYCTFAETPSRVKQPYMSVDEAVSVAQRGSELGCKEALFTLGERPELRYRVAREWLAAHGFSTTIHYLTHVADVVRERTGLLPHINAGCMTAEEIALLRPRSASMGLMLESTSERLSARGGPHHGSPDKSPAARLETIAEAGRQRVPFTTGLLIGIGETREERIETLLAIRELHERFGHIQEVIVQNFVPKPGTPMSGSVAPDLHDLVWSIAVARLVLGPRMNIQAPPNLSPAALQSLIGAGINDWGGVSPLTPDYVNPESPWPEIERLSEQTQAAGKTLVERLTIYPGFAREPHLWLDPAMHRSVLRLSDGAARARENTWRAGTTENVPSDVVVTRRSIIRQTRIARLLDEILRHGAQDMDRQTQASLFDARGADFHGVCEAADEVRSEAVGEVATYVINRNINYTNICGYHCTFCAFSKGPRKHVGGERPYVLDLEEIGNRVREARAGGAGEVCLQGGIHPSFTGETYLSILEAVKTADPRMHVHAFSPLEIWHGAETLGMQVSDFLALLKGAGLGSLPGTAAEILQDPVRKILCPDKITTDQWLEVIEAAHAVGLRTTATIMFGHVDDYLDWVIHLGRLRDLQRRTGGFTEFVPLPFVAQEAPLYRRGHARPGPTFREAILMHAVARLILFPHFRNIQASWVKLGRQGMREALRAGANDLGGTLMNESITRAAGATHGQEMSVEEMRTIAAELGRTAARRTTLYGCPDDSGAALVSTNYVHAPRKLHGRARSLT